MASIEPERRARLRDLADIARQQEPTTTEWDGLTNRVRATPVLAQLQRRAVDGGLAFDTATDAAEDLWPAEYLEAFARLGHDETYGVGTQAGLYGLFDHLTDDQMQGLVNSVKGTVLEIRVREMIETGDLAGAEYGDDVTASLSESLTQGGHDIEVADASGEMVGALQVKAGDWSGVSRRIDEYANAGIPVAVTSETAARAEAAGHGQDVIDTGLSGAELTAEATDIIDNLGLGHAVDELVPEAAGLILIATAAMRLRAGEPFDDVRRQLTTELGDLGVANASAVAIELMTGMIMLRPVTALGTKWGMTRLRTASAAQRALSQQRERIASHCASR